MLVRLREVFLALVLATPLMMIAQSQPGATPPTLATENGDQVASILGLSDKVAKIRAARSKVACGAMASVEELSMRQDILETIVAASLDVDGVLAELENERAQLSELSARLQSRRDRSVNIANVANLITGTGIGIGVNAMQFSNATANIGNGLGVGSGIASTLLSIVGVHLQHGPQAPIGRVPNMLAPLFGTPPKLNAYYPATVLAYLRAAPTGNGTSRFDQLMSEWQQSGRIAPANSPQGQSKITLLTASSEDKAKLSIDDLSDRIAMLGDVTGRVALMKRDLAALMVSIGRTSCDQTL